jgi:hypothetical protein
MLIKGTSHIIFQQLQQLLTTGTHEAFLLNVLPPT